MTSQIWHFSSLLTLADVVISRTTPCHLRLFRHLFLLYGLRRCLSTTPASILPRQDLRMPATHGTLPQINPQGNNATGRRLVLAIDLVGDHTGVCAVCNNIFFWICKICTYLCQQGKFVQAPSTRNFLHLWRLSQSIMNTGPPLDANVETIVTKNKSA